MYTQKRIADTTAPSFTRFNTEKALETVPSHQNSLSDVHDEKKVQINRTKVPFHYFPEEQAMLRHVKGLLHIHEA